MFDSLYGLRLAMCTAGVVEHVDDTTRRNGIIQHDETLMVCPRSLLREIHSVKLNGRVIYLFIDRPVWHVDRRSWVDPKRQCKQSTFEVEKYINTNPKWSYQKDVSMKAYPGSTLLRGNRCPCVLKFVLNLIQWLTFWVIEVFVCVTWSRAIASSRARLQSATIRPTANRTPAKMNVQQL